MSRPCKLRRVNCNPQAMSFKPCGGGRRAIETVTLSLDELEALRLADYEGLYQEEAAGKMSISRQTFGAIVGSAHKKVADFLVNSKHLSVGGGSVEISTCGFVCAACRHTWTSSCGEDRPRECPHCTSADFNCLKSAHRTTNPKHCWRNA